MPRERFIEPLRFRGLLRKAYDKGAQPVDICTVRWDAAGGCSDPVFSLLWSVSPTAFWRDTHQPKTTLKISSSPYIVREIPARKKRVIYEQGSTEGKQRRFLEIFAPCRKCPTCLRNRARLWKRRCTAEIHASSRTWMATFTVGPAQRVRFKILAKRSKHNEDFAAVAGEVQKEFTKWLKRVRKKSKVRFRYCLVVEAHKDGFPHLHALVHEGQGKLTKRLMEREWQAIGFTNFRLCDETASGYVTKYLLKSNLARVRASLRYGTTYGIVIPKGNVNNHDPTTFNEE